MTQDPRLDAFLAKARARCPTLDDLETRARRRIPHFAHEFLQGGAGNDCGGRANHRALDAITIVPRYGLDMAHVDTGVTLFGRRYAAPLGIAPVGLDGMMWPGGTAALARAAQQLRIPYVTGMLASLPLEEVIGLAPDVTWLQLYPIARDDHAMTRAMMARAGQAGVDTLVVTLDIPARAKRPRDRRARLAAPFRIGPAVMWEAAKRPAWLAAVARHGAPRFATMAGLTGLSRPNDVAAFVQAEVGRGFTWAQLDRLRAAWPGKMLVKGILHPADAMQAVSLGMDGVYVSNHGGRQYDSAPPAINVLPEIARVMAGRGPVLFDSGIRSGGCAAKAVACGADLALSGRGFITAMAALGDHGALHYGQSLLEEYRLTMAQCGLLDMHALRAAPLRHPSAWSAADFRTTGLMAGGTGG